MGQNDVDFDTGEHVTLPVKLTVKVVFLNPDSEGPLNKVLILTQTIMFPYPTLPLTK